MSTFKDIINYILFAIVLGAFIHALACAVHALL